MRRRRRSVRLIAAIAVIAAVAAAARTGPSARAHGLNPLELSSFGAAAVDGAISRGEYGNGEGCSPLTTILAPKEAGRDAGFTTYHARACVSNDLVNAYYAFQIDDLTGPGAQGVDVVTWFFDDEHDGTVRCGDAPAALQDAIGAAILSVHTTDAFDAAYCTGAFDGFQVIRDDLKGVSAPDVTAEATFTAGVGSVFELSHPLNSGDPEDYALGLTDTVGFCIAYNDNGAEYSVFGAAGFPNSCFGNSGLLGTLFGDILLRNPWEELHAKLESLFDSCEPCPPKVIVKLDEILHAALSAAERGDEAAALDKLRTFTQRVKRLVRNGKVPKATGHELRSVAKDFIAEHS